MSFFRGADAYDRFMGRYSVPLAPTLADFAAVSPGQRALDVGPEAVSAVDPSEPFVAAAQERHPGVSVQRAAAEDLPFEDEAFDITLAQLVVHFMADPIAGLREMARVTRNGGVVAASVWDHFGGRGPLSPYWNAARELDPSVDDESQLAGARKGHLAELFESAGLGETEETALTIHVEHQSFEDWWEPFTLGVGPAGAYVAGLDETRRVQLRDLCRERLPSAPFVLEARAWAARGSAG